MSLALGISLKRKRNRLWKEELIKLGLKGCALLSLVTTASIIIVLFTEALGFFQEISLWDFLTGTRWTPLFNPSSFGVLPLLGGTFMVAIGAGLIAVPLGVGIGLYLSEYAKPKTRKIIKPILEILAGIPTVVYGYFAMIAITPALRWVFPSTQIFNAASGAIVVGIMILPMISSLCDDAFRAVPRNLRQAAFAMGATPFEVSSRIVLPAALSGVIASFILAFSRAIGETMAVTLAAGATPNLTMNPLESIQTMTAYIVQVSLGDTPAGSMAYRTLFAVALLLFVITLVMNVISNYILRRYREVYQ